MSNQFPPSGVCTEQLEWHFYHASLIHFGINIIKEWGPRHLAGTIFCNTPGIFREQELESWGVRWDTAVLLWPRTSDIVLWRDTLTLPDTPTSVCLGATPSFPLGKGPQSPMAPLLEQEEAPELEDALKSSSHLFILCKMPTPYQAMI